MLAALGHRGFQPSAIAEMYPGLSATNVAEAIDLEVQLDHNLRARAA
jgi:hypothetical protein